MRSRPQRPADAGERPAPRARPRRDQGAVPADRPAGGPHHRGLRGAAALGPPAPRPARAAATSSRSPRRRGLIVNLGVFALERTARELAAWQSALDVDPPIFASVNVSSRQLLRHDLLHDVKTVLARTGVLPGLAQARDHREPRDGEPGIRGADADAASATSAPACRSTISAPAIRRCPTCSASRSTRSRSTRSFVRQIGKRHAPGHPALDRQDGARTRHGGRRRGRRDRDATRSSSTSSAANTRKATPSASPVDALQARQLVGAAPEAA